MDTSRSIGVISTGSYVPRTVVDNDEIARRAVGRAQRIERQAVIPRPRRAANRTTTADLAAASAEQAIKQGGLTAGHLSHIVVVTRTPDRQQPATAGIVQRLIGASQATAIDVDPVYGGFVYALAMTERILRAGPEGMYALVVGADAYSRFLDHPGGGSACASGDGAGAVVLGSVPHGQGMMATSLLTRGDLHQMTSGRMTGGRTDGAEESRRPASATTLGESRQLPGTSGPGARPLVLEYLPAAIQDLLSRAGMSQHEVRHFVPQRADGMILAEARPCIGLRSAILHLARERYGNTGSASIPITLDLVHRQGALTADDAVVLSGFGSGMSVGCALLRWAPTLFAGSR
jgi:3-oxoacyl-[acyl-carrier-protein] synthase-3